MINKYHDAEKLFRQGTLTYFELAGKNSKVSHTPKLTFIGHFEPVDKLTITRNYELISRNLEVYPTINIYPAEHKLDGDMGGLYHADENHIDLINHAAVISIIAHEMRHAFQYIYFPDIYYAREYKSVAGYLDCDVERDARRYAMDYCTAKQYWSDVRQLEYDENLYEQVVQKKVSPKSIGFSNSYFSKNRSIAYTVPRDYHLQNQYAATHSPNFFQRMGSGIANLFRFAASAAVAAGILYALIATEEDNTSVVNVETAAETAVDYEYAFDETSLADFINAYRYNYELALYYEDFSYIADQVQEDSAVYNELAVYIDQISGQEMVFDFTDLVIEEIEILSDHALIHTYEAFDFMNAAGEWSVEERNKRYKVIITEDGYYEVAEIIRK